MNIFAKLFSAASAAIILIGGAVATPEASAQAAVVFPQQKQPGAAGLARKSPTQWTLSNALLSAQFALNPDGALTFDGCKALDLLPGTELFSIELADGRTINSSSLKPLRISTVDLAATPDAAKEALRFAGKALQATYQVDGLELRWRAVLRDGSHYLRTELTLTAEGRDITTRAITPMIYRVEVPEPAAMPAVVGNTRGSILASDRLFAGLETPTAFNSVVEPQAPGNVAELRGLWSRATTLQRGKSWNISAVVGIIAPGQGRRSVLAYSERERAAAWRPFPIYNSWYELNIDRNNARDYSNHMTEAQCLDVIGQWKRHLKDENGSGIRAFVWDDGWDSYGTWGFNPNFPNGFKNLVGPAAEMGAGTGGWLGPVGGYGASGEMRRAYWADQGKMQLSNPDYYDVFLGACSNLIENHGFCFFKLDGISAQFSSVGPDEGDRGNENAEAIIDIEQRIRELRPDVFLNTTVGTWASPFWYHFTDATWRQEGDYGEIGDQGSDRERWITYRDRLVHQNYVENAPLTPINTLMTHGVILTRFGQTSKDMDYEGIRREIRCAFACGSGMVELYTDYALLDSINGGALWKDLAECIAWQQRNADVLPDAHWVGGNPWDGEKANVYGWASWNGPKSTLALRNPAASPQTFTTTLRQALDIPAYVKGSVTLTPAFADQSALPGLPVGTPVNIDRELRLDLPASSVFVYDGRSN